MNNRKCHYCGFINFVYAEVCKKCKAILGEIPAQSGYDFSQTYRGGVNAYAAPYPTKSVSPVMKVLACVGAAVVLLAFFGALGAGVIINRKRKVNWTEYRPDGLNFTVMMPNEPKRLEPVLTPLPNGNMSNHRYISIVSGQGVAMFCFVDFSGDVFGKEEAEAGLDAELSSFLQRTNATLISKTKITYQGMPGIEFEMSPPESMSTKRSRSYGKMFLSMSRLYLLSITASEGSDLLAGKDKFLNPQVPVAFAPRKLGFHSLADLRPAPVYQPWAAGLR